MSFDPRHLHVFLQSENAVELGGLTIFCSSNRTQIVWTGLKCPLSRHGDDTKYILILHGLNTEVKCQSPFADSFADRNRTLT